MSFDIQTLEFHLQREKLSLFAKNKIVQSSLLNLPILNDEHAIEESWQYIDEALMLINKYQAFPLNSQYDCLALYEMIQKDHQLTLDEANTVLISIDNQVQMYEYLNQLDSSIELLFKKNYPIQNMTVLYDKLKSVIDEDGNIKDDATPQLRSIRKKLKHIDQRYLKSLHDMMTHYSAYLNEQVVVIRGDAYCLAVSDSYKNNIKGITHDISQSKQTIYIEPLQSKAIRDEKFILFEEEKIEILKILKYLTQTLQHQIDTLITHMHTLRFYDSVHAKAQFALHLHAQRPHIDHQEFHLIAARHPALTNKVTPIDVFLDKAHKGLFISGSNTGGKTVTLKTIGLLHLMAQAGLFIPASSQSKVMLCDHILADIGDMQSIEHNLSTFSSHLKKHQMMLAHTNHKTLLLIDEIGSGTDPQEGVAIAQALIEAYEEKGASFVVTTHYQALKQFAIKKAYLNASVAFDQETLQPTYHIEYGLLGHSHAFDIATRIGIDSVILKKAKDHYTSLQTENEKLLIELEKKEQLLATEKKQIQQEYETLKQQQIKLQIQHELFEKNKDDILSKIINEKEKEIKEKIDKIDHILKELKDKKQIPISQYASYKNMQQHIQQKDAIQYDTDFDIGDEVYIQSYDQIGIVEKVKKDRYIIRVGSFELEFQKKDLSKPMKKEVLPKKVQSPVKQKKTTHTSKPSSDYVFQLDLRGFRFDDVKPALDKAIDQAILSNQSSLRIIHGYGTGAVKKAVYDIIKNHPEITSYRYGQEGEGLTGATVIFFK